MGTMSLLPDRWRVAWSPSESRSTSFEPAVLTSLLHTLLQQPHTSFRNSMMFTEAPRDTWTWSKLEIPTPEGKKWISLYFTQCSQAFFITKPYVVEHQLTIPGKVCVSWVTNAGNYLHKMCSFLLLQIPSICSNQVIKAFG